MAAFLAAISFSISSNGGRRAGALFSLSETISKLAGRLRGVDALRGAAALGVVLYHEVGSKPHLHNGAGIRWLLAPLWAISSFGYAGVFLFFVISGFCIHLHWARRRLGEENVRTDFKAFWKRRIRRLYPPYLCALLIYLVVAAFTTPFQATALYVWDLVLHLLMLHNLDARTTYSINGVFWTLAIEEQLYLAYFLLLFLRNRFGWSRTLMVCLGGRFAWFLFVLGAERWLGLRIPLAEGALSHWFTWALGAVSVEAALGIVVLPKWCTRISIAAIILLVAVGLTQVLPGLHSNQLAHDSVWLLLHPVWGLAFFIIVNRAVMIERNWRRSGKTPAIVRGFASVGLFSYSLYLTHELVLMEAYRFESLGLSETVVQLAIMTPATLVFAWVFFVCCERPYLRPSASGRSGDSSPTQSSTPYLPIPMPGPSAALSHDARSEQA